MPIRENPRVAVTWQVHVFSLGWDEVLEMEAVDLSATGAFIATDVEVAEGTNIQLTFRVPERDLEVTVFGDVVRSVPQQEAGTREMPAGVGVSFMNPPEAFVSLLQELIPEAQPEADEPEAGEPEAGEPEADEPSSGHPLMQLPDPPLLDDAMAASIEDDSPTELLGEGWWRDSLDGLREQLQQRQGGDPVGAPPMDEPKGAPLIDSYDEPEEHDPIQDNPGFILERVHQYMEHDRWLEAQHWAMQLLDAHPEDIEIKVNFHLACAGLFHQNGDEENAVLHWKDAVALDPENEQAIEALRDVGMTKTQQTGLLQRFLGFFRRKKA